MNRYRLGAVEVLSGSCGMDLAVRATDEFERALHLRPEVSKDVMYAL